MKILVALLSLLTSIIFTNCTKSPPTSPPYDSYTENNKGITVIALDTAPNIRSEIFTKVLKHLKYDYYLLRNNPHDPHPNSGPWFKELLWHYRTLRYKGILEIMPKDEIIILSDVRDVIFAGEAEKVIAKFKSMNKEVVASSTFLCCTHSWRKYLLEYLKSNDLDFSFMKDNPTEHEQHQIFQTQVQYSEKVLSKKINDPKYGWYWMDEQREVIEKLSNPEKDPNIDKSPNIYVNAGTIIGTKSALLNMFKKIDSKPWDDDELNLNLYFANLTNFKDETPDFYEQIFGIVSPPTKPLGGELKFLRNSFKEGPLSIENKTLPFKEFFRYTYDQENDDWLSIWGKPTYIFHCPGCSDQNVKEMMSTVINKSFPEIIDNLSKEEQKELEISE